MASSSNESFLYLDYPPTFSRSKTDQLPNGSILLADKTPRPYGLYPVPSPDLNRPYRKDSPFSTRERPVSCCPDMTPGLQQCQTMSPRMLRRFSDSTSLGLETGEYIASIPRHSQLDMSGSHQSGFTKESIRRPPIKYRQSWRYGTDFGLTGRTGDGGSKFGQEESSPESLNSTRLGNYAHSTSEDGLSSSVYECTASDFPAPPPITSPVIRRMRSSPWYMDDSLSEQQRRVRMALNESLNHSLGNRADKRSMNRLGSSSTTSFGNLSGPHRTTESFEHSMPRDNLEWTRRICLQGTLPSSKSEKVQWHQRSVPVLQRSNAEGSLPVRSQRSLTTLQQSASMPHANAVIPTPEEISLLKRQTVRPMGRLPRIIRKVASMRSEAQKAEVPKVQSGPVGGRSIPKSRSFRTLLQSSEADRARERTNDAGGEWHRPSSWVLGNPSQIERPSFSGVDSNFSDNRENKMSKRQHLSVPAHKANGSSEETDRRGSGKNGVLGAPFLPFASHSSRKGNSTQEQCETPNSFINISPDRGKSDSKTGSKRDRMKLMIARASTSIFGWGKPRANRNPS